ncbi:DNA replication/repair protein RecF [Pseudoxanthomonas yeongjuensis]|uniref:DNA replication/repair protein RecF n=1 Tax=Pseudoxanthomonas yeongjuensis TaxID=377616 RepID=UPI001390B2C4|nr:DNA replication/repair protein RecF [Pseudoxanthomonas yeongjuensis]KAF1713796.1 DNA replication/repair protein RecF [Pseudoxanthomonas yeongjuensis]
MHVIRLTASGLRRFDSASIDPAPGLNLITGDNGAGKTSLLEALHLMAYGRSFRGRVRDGLVRTGAEAVEVFVEWREGAEARHRRAGLRHTGQTWVGRLDGQNVSQLGELCAALAVVSFEPGSHALVTGGGEPRRRFVDWGLFHVEPGFLPLWRRYARALKQRNALLKSGAGGPQLDAWDHELVETGEPMTRHRQHYLEQLQTRLLAVAGDLVPALGASSIEFQPGWRSSELSLADALLLARDRDRGVGYTTVGPHRADWRIDYAGHPHRESLSRGQAKLSALSALLAQAEDYAQRRGEWPIVALDDLASELDRNHQRRVLQRLVGSGAQVFVTGTESPSALTELEVAPTWFHVEHGLIQLR